MPTQIFLIRHGETAWSLSGQHTGRKDVPLTANGERQASELRERLANVAFDHVYTSPLQRARRTCELAGYRAVARVDSDVQEWDYGDDEGLTRDAIREVNQRATGGSGDGGGALKLGDIFGAQLREARERTKERKKTRDEARTRAQQLAEEEEWDGDADSIDINDVLADEDES